MRREELRGMAVIALALLFLFGAAPASAAPPPVGTAASSRFRVHVRVDTGTAGRLVRITGLMDTVRAIWQPYADITFADVAEAATDVFDYTVRLIVSDRLPPAQGAGPPLGWITFIAPEEPESLVTVSVATALNVMSREKWLGRRIDQLPAGIRQEFVTRLVGWSAAHELGHYLLRTSAHSASGLMKARLTAEEVMRNDRASQRLEPQQVEALRDRAARETLLSKLRAEPAPDAP
jgi:hypothetical protein